jgi:nucleoside-diphosphate-sugar epimerase
VILFEEQEILKKMRILVTGAAGFLGSHLTDLLIADASGGGAETQVLGKRPHFRL